MINLNGNIVEDGLKLSVGNRAFKYGDGLFETMKVIHGKIVFVEDHYFRLMASMRMLRMHISMGLTLEYFEKEILKTVAANKLTEARVRLSVYRKDGGLYLPKNNEVGFLIEVHQLVVTIKKDYKIDLFKDYYVNSGLLSTLKTNNRILNVLASIYADENELDNCILINERKQVVETINANIFLIKDKKIKTPSLSEGCIKGVVRKNLIALVKKEDDLEVEETEISPFELQKADEVFITNTIVGIQPVIKYRKKTFTTEISTYLSKKLIKISVLS
ncbi:MAG TPA: aminotransferase class IV [Flavobacteriaceae bacterium]|jgi:branched-chain amino acid aminotransferase|nr:aminotransferase class IV [Flavobacteriaceae bacterium]